MRNRISFLFVPLFIIAATAILSTMPPLRGQSQTVPDPIIAPGVLRIDTASLAKDIERVNMKAAVLSTRTRIISKNSKGLLRDARNLERAVSELKPTEVKMDTLIVVYPSFSAEKIPHNSVNMCPAPDRPKMNFWQRLKYLFNP